MLTNFELKQLKPKLDIVKKPENRVHELTDSISNVSHDAISSFGFNRVILTVQAKIGRHVRFFGIVPLSMFVLYLTYDAGPTRDLAGEAFASMCGFRPCVAGQVLYQIPKDFVPVRNCFVAQIRAKMCVRAP